MNRLIHLNTTGLFANAHCLLRTVHTYSQFLGENDIFSRQKSPAKPLLQCTSNPFSATLYCIFKPSPLIKEAELQVCCS